MEQYSCGLVLVQMAAGLWWMNGLCWHGMAERTVKNATPCWNQLEKNVRSVNKKAKKQNRKKKSKKRCREKGGKMRQWREEQVEWEIDRSVTSQAGACESPQGGRKQTKLEAPEQSRAVVSSSVDQLAGRGRHVQQLLVSFMMFWCICLTACFSLVLGVFVTLCLQWYFLSQPLRPQTPSALHNTNSVVTDLPQVSAPTHLWPLSKQPAITIDSKRLTWTLCFSPYCPFYFSFNGCFHQLNCTSSARSCHCFVANLLASWVELLSSQLPFYD